MLEEHIDANYDGLSKTLDTLGKGEMPEMLTKSATELRGRVAGLYGAELAEEGELQGYIREKIRQELDDPDIEVTRWIREKSTPLGTTEPSVTCGVFPQWKRSKPVTKPTIGLRHGITHLSQSIRREPRSCFERSMSKDG